MNQFADERVHALRVGGKRPVLIYADVMGMHYYNGQYGYQKGNEFLRHVAETLRESFPDALAIRGQDDHFILIDASDERRRLEENIALANNAIRRGAEGSTVGIKTGVCIYEEGMRTIEALDHARNALKWIGNDLNRICNFYAFVDEDQLWNQRYVIESFDQAMAEGWIKVYYQGISRVETGKGTAFEALARWIDPVRGILSPNEFIPVLKKYHLLHKLDLFIAEQVCREYPLRVSEEVPVLPVSVNFSAQDFDYTDIPGALEEIYRRYQVPDIAGEKSLIVEITEQDMAKAEERLHEQVRRLRRNGFRIWLDDFGSGYSSLNAFGRYDIDLIKFDLDLLRNLDENNGANRRIMKAMVEVARELGIHTLAEGMETAEHKAFLQEIGCELAQGYLYHRPEPIAAMLYRQKNGQKPRPYETADERKHMREKWYNGT
jgi:EAL domain-containing protein (putative c-di-GMP-specific phosphodiesterase class I)/GGDEF domain-containing protein